MSLSRSKVFTSNQVEKQISKQSKSFYIYQLIDPFSFLVKYVGKGTSLRCLDHFKQCEKDNGSKSRWLQKLKKKGKEPFYLVSNFTNNEDKAYDNEKELIKLIGRKKDGGPLLNITRGGKGGHRSAITSKELIDKLKKKHNNIYSYPPSFSHFHKNMYSLIPIICPIHGRFEQKANNHLNGQGCPKCGGTQKKTLKEFAEEVELKFPKQFDYTNSIYVSRSEPIEILCKKCGWLNKTTPFIFLNGKGCVACDNTGAKKMDTKLFIHKAKMVHGNLYNYDNVDYINAKEKVDILCTLCDEEFSQSPNNHLAGNGCPNKCIFK